MTFHLDTLMSSPTLRSKTLYHQGVFFRLIPLRSGVPNVHIVVAMEIYPCKCAFSRNVEFGERGNVIFVQPQQNGEECVFWISMK